MQTDFYSSVIDGPAAPLCGTCYRPLLNGRCDTPGCPEAVMVRKRANGKRSGAWIRPTRRLAINLRDELRCVWCQKDLHGAAPRDVTLDHLVPRTLGGTHDAVNLVTACQQCNSLRKDTPWRVFARRFPGSARRVENQRRRSLTRYVRLARAMRAPEAP